MHYKVCIIDIVPSSYQSVPGNMFLSSRTLCTPALRSPNHRRTGGDRGRGRTKICPENAAAKPGGHL